MKLKSLVLALVLAATMHAKCERSDAGPVLQVLIDAGCAIHWVGHVFKVAGKAIKKVVS